MKLKIDHITRYDYDRPVDFALEKVRLRPLDSAMQTVGDWTVAIDGGTIQTGYQDHYGNHVDLVSATPGTRTLSLRASGTVTTLNSTGVVGHVYGTAPLWHFAQPTPLTTAGPQIAALADKLHGAGDTVTKLHDISASILAAVPYEGGHTGSQTTAEEAVTIGYGVCQDHANILISVARAAGLPARYVSGYLMMNDRIDQDATHGWADVHIKDLGWVGFDVSNGVSPDERYARIAIGRDARDAAPISGLRRGAATEGMFVAVQVQQ